MTGRQLMGEKLVNERGKSMDERVGGSSRRGEQELWEEGWHG